MEIELPINATEAQIRERCFVLADAELIGMTPEESWKCEIETRGALYLEGEIDVELYDEPRLPRVLEKQEEEIRWSLLLNQY
jgi:hypothetical protein